MGLFIKSHYGYGSAGSPPKIPGDATLVFEIELFDFHGEDISKDKDMGVVKRTKTAGEGYDQPNDGSQVEIELVGRVGGRTFDERNLEFEVGEGLNVNIPRGIEFALEKMKKKEVAQITLKPAYGFGSAGCPALGVEGSATLVYELTLVKFEKAKESWQLDAEQKLEQARIFKEKGTKHFKDQKYEIASSRYQKVIDFLEHEISLKGEAEDERKALLQAGRLNLAMCHLKMSQWIELAESVIRQLKRMRVLPRLGSAEERRTLLSMTVRLPRQTLRGLSSWTQRTKLPRTKSPSASRKSKLKRRKRKRLLQTCLTSLPWLTGKRKPWRSR